MAPDEIRQADAAYRPFPPFEKWIEGLHVDNEAWNMAKEKLALRGQASPEGLKRAKEVAARASAIETGAIEGLYETDRGFTYTVAMQTAMADAMLDSKGRPARAIIESQMRAYEYVLDFATQKQPVTETWIRQLHEELCAGQDTYSVFTEIGPQEQKLPKGKYKIHPNHPRRQDGKIHSYAPVDMTPNEMHRFVKELGSEAFQNAHPVLQAAYAHYAFVCIHPFADGNGRVSRALASIYTYRSQGVPIMILADNRNVYFDVLEAADKGQYQPFVDFIFSRTMSSVGFAEEILRTAMAPDIEDAAGRLLALHTTKSGITPAKLDDAGNRIIESFHKNLDELIKEYVVKSYVTATWLGGKSVPPAQPGFRVLKDDQKWKLRLISHPPAHAQVAMTIYVEIPVNVNEHDFIRLVCDGVNDLLEINFGDIVPDILASTHLRLRVFAERVLGQAFAKLSTLAEDSLKQL